MAGLRIRKKCGVDVVVINKTGTRFVRRQAELIRVMDTRFSQEMILLVPTQVGRNSLTGEAVLGAETLALDARTTCSLARAPDKMLALRAAVELIGKQCRGLPSYREQQRKRLEGAVCENARTRLAAQYARLQALLPS